MPDFNHALDRDITSGIARALFLTAWADHEEAAGRTYPGMVLDNVAPKTPDFALQHGAFVIGTVETANHLCIEAIYSQACKADGVDYERVCRASRDELGDEESAVLMQHANSFGFAVGMMALGTGVSWFDDHGDFELNDGLSAKRELQVPLTEFQLDPEPAQARRLASPKCAQETGLSR